MCIPSMYLSTKHSYIVLGWLKTYSLLYCSILLGFGLFSLLIFFAEHPFSFFSKFCVRKEFLTSPDVLKKRLIFVGIAMLILSPCLVIFPLVYVILRHAEEIYNHPSTASSRRWSNLSRWIFREYNEVAYSQNSLFPLLSL